MTKITVLPNWENRRVLTRLANHKVFNKSLGQATQEELAQLVHIFPSHFFNVEGDMPPKIVRDNAPGDPLPSLDG